MPLTPHTFSWRQTLSQAVRLIRRARRFKVRELAALMAMKSRSYEYFESGRARPNLERILRLAEVSDADFHAMLAAMFIGSPRFALRAADNKLMTAFLIRLEEFDSELGDTVALLETGAYVTAFGAAFDALTQEARRRAVQVEPRDQDGG
jgi:transcriptional regulator with XRE-family HTH domain